MYSTVSMTVGDENVQFDSDENVQFDSDEHTVEHIEQCVQHW